MPSELLDRVKIQAEVLVPVLRAFRAAMGEEAANRVAWEALAEWRNTIVRDRSAEVADLPAPGVARWGAAVQAGMPFIGDAVDVEYQTLTDAAVEFDITSCRFAQFFRELDEPELGFAMLCAVDETQVELDGGGEVTLNRPTTIMQGGDRCRFRYALQQSGLPSA